MNPRVGQISYEIPFRRIGLNPFAELMVFKPTLGKNRYQTSALVVDVVHCFMVAEL